MGLLIDGYNLMFAAGLAARAGGPGGLERSRLALLNFVAGSVAAAELVRTKVVFDSSGAPPGLPEVLNHRGLTVHFASRHEDADALIEELIQHDSAPRQLIVVSSDHRLQRAARRRRATAIDSDIWFGDAQRRRDRAHRPVVPDSLPEKPPVSLDVDYWLAQFADVAQTTSDQSTGDQPGDPIFPPEYLDELARLEAESDVTAPPRKGAKPPTGNAEKRTPKDTTTE